MQKTELLSPAGDFESMVSAVQNGANAVYFGANRFNSRMNSNNFDEEELIKAITYAKLRNVKTHLTLNTLIKNSEFEDALKTMQLAYQAGLDAVIVQDLGLAKRIIEMFPDIEVHGSTQMTIHNLDGVKQLEKLGFKRVVLARELNIDEISNICKKTNIEIEIFIHGALCISYSGQCLMSSIIDGRSGNRGRCAGTCRLPYELIEKDNNRCLDKGYLLSSKDVCALDILPELIKTGVKSFKIEGRMKSPEYVGIVTNIYRKYIDLAYSNKKYIVEDQDKEKLLQIFNRGGSSTGYLKGKLAKDMMYTKRPNHMGILIGEVHSYNPNKGYVKFKAEKEIELGDSICINDNSCKMSELMEENKNIKIAKIGQSITIGRIKGNIKPGDKIYKTVSYKLNKDIIDFNYKENIKRDINCYIELKQDKPVKIVFEDIYTKLKTEYVGVNINHPQIAHKEGTKKERIEEQILKTGNTIFNIKNIEIDMEDNIFVPISSINEMRREGLAQIEKEILNTFKRNMAKINTHNEDIKLISNNKEDNKKEITLLVNNINSEMDYTQIKGIDSIYIPFKYFIKNNQNIHDICKTFKTYIYLPTITRPIYEGLVKRNLEDILDKYKLEGVVISNISQVELLNNIDRNNLKLIANYTMNIFNNESVRELEKLGFDRYIISPELDKDSLNSIEGNIEKEIIAYGRTVLMTSEYCPIGVAKNCNQPCQKGNYVLKDRLGFEFPIYTDTISCNTYIYNSKITSIDYKNLKADSIRIDILDESIEEINNIITKYKNDEKLEGKDYTNGNLNKEI